MKYRDVIRGRQWMGRVEKGEDLLEALTRFARSNQVRLGIVQGIGALQKARLSIYDQEKQEYDTLEIDKPVEVTNLTGNISLKDGAIFCHLHATLADREGKALGGHVSEGCKVFAFEFIVQDLVGDAFHRAPEEETGLTLWDI